nr:hypothetical protein [Sphingomonas gellani]
MESSPLRRSEPMLVATFGQLRSSSSPASVILLPGEPSFARGSALIYLRPALCVMVTSPDAIDEFVQNRVDEDAGAVVSAEVRVARTPCDQARAPALSALDARDLRGGDAARSRGDLGDGKPEQPALLPQTRAEVSVLGVPDRTRDIS